MYKCNFLGVERDLRGPRKKNKENCGNEGKNTRKRGRNISVNENSLCVKRTAKAFNIGFSKSHNDTVQEIGNVSLIASQVSNTSIQNDSISNQKTTMNPSSQCGIWQKLTTWNKFQPDKNFQNLNKECTSEINLIQTRKASTFLSDNREVEEQIWNEIRDSDILSSLSIPARVSGCIYPE